MGKSKIITTADGSHSIFSIEINETYHSKHGAIKEAKHVFIKNGLLSIHKKKINILEVGFGTGLNTLLTFKKANTNRIINYHTIEKYPLKKEEYIQLNYCKILNINSPELITIHEKSWDKQHNISDFFYLKKHLISLENYHANINFDIIYFDAFSPRKQKEMWSFKILNKMYQMLNKNGCLVTYCAQGEVKRNLKKIGFELEILPGPPGKREMIKANRI